MDEPGQQLCQDALLNDIESTTLARWPVPVTIALAPLPYTCTKARGSGHQLLPVANFSARSPRRRRRRWRCWTRSAAR